MRILSGIAKSGLGLLALGTLFACSGLNLGTAGLLQSVDFFSDDISQMTFAIDAPLSILPQDDGMLYKLEATTRELGDRQVAAVLVRGDDILAFSGLTAPANNRTYHLFAFSQASQIEVHEFQTWLKDMKENNDDVGGQLTMNMELKFCRVSDIDVSNARLSIYVSLPNQGALKPLFSNVTLSEMGGGQTGELPLCTQT